MEVLGHHVRLHTLAMRRRAILIVLLIIIPAAVEVSGSLMFARATVLLQDHQHGYESEIRGVYSRMCIL